MRIAFSVVIACFCVSSFAAENRSFMEVEFEEYLLAEVLNSTHDENVDSHNHQDLHIIAVNTVLRRGLDSSLSSKALIAALKENLAPLIPRVSIITIDEFYKPFVAFNPAQEENHVLAENFENIFAEVMSQITAKRVMLIWYGHAGTPYNNIYKLQLETSIYNQRSSIKYAANDIWSLVNNNQNIEEFVTVIQSCHSGAFFLPEIRIIPANRKFSYVGIASSDIENSSRSISNSTAIRAVLLDELTDFVRKQQPSSTEYKLGLFLWRNFKDKKFYTTQSVERENGRFNIATEIPYYTLCMARNNEEINASDFGIIPRVYCAVIANNPVVAK